MKKIIVLSDSFKGGLSSREIARIAKSEIAKQFPACEVVPLMAADGGEGTVDCLVEMLSGEKRTAWVTGPWGERIDSFYGVKGDTAFVEMAAAAGLPLAGSRRDPSKTTTYGVGELIAHAVTAGAKKVILGLGGSATNDGGCGCAAALGVIFLDKNGKEFVPVGETLADICGIDVREAANRLEGVQIEVMCDVDNPLCGARGAAAVFGGQKGADSDMIASLDAGLRHLACEISRATGADVLAMPGGGAAGGFGAGAAALLNAKMHSGIDSVLDAADFESRLTGCDLVITGEGRIDGQSLSGKVPVGVARRAAKKGVPVVAVVGDVGDDAYAVYGEGVSAIFSINRVAVPVEQAQKRAADDYASTIKDIMRLIAAVHCA